MGFNLILKLLVYMEKRVESKDIAENKLTILKQEKKPQHGAT